MDKPAVENEEQNLGDSPKKKSIGNSCSSIQNSTSSEILNNSTTGLYYKIDDDPPFYLTLALGFQHYLTTAGSAVSVPFILCPAMCMLEDDVGRAEMISSIMFVSGIVTLCQSTFGTRLPIVQGGSFAFLVPALAILSLPEWKCPTKSALMEMSQEERTEEWQRRMREIQGAIIVASITEIFLGFFGIVGLILKYITPMTVAPAITMMSLSLFKVSARNASSNWGIALLTIVLVILFSQYMKKFKVPIPFTKSELTGKMSRFPFFEIFSVLLAIGIVWAVCGVLTITGCLPERNAARTDIKLKIIEQSSWITLPYPFQFGWPTVSAGAVLGMISGVIAGIVESVGDYYACARISGTQIKPLDRKNILYKIF